MLVYDYFIKPLKGHSNSYICDKLEEFYNNKNVLDNLSLE